jgi:hypothetical protein
MKRRRGLSGPTARRKVKNVEDVFWMESERLTAGGRSQPSRIDGRSDSFLRNLVGPKPGGFCGAGP